MKIRKQDIIAIEGDLIDGIKSSDVDFLDNILHNDLLFIAPNGQTVTKEMDLASHRAGEMVVEEIISSIDQINIIDDDTAIVTVFYKTKGTMLGAPIQGKFKYIRVWKKFEDGLKVIGGSCMMIPE
jgi:ketosteroid isomerase-like protein